MNPRNESLVKAEHPLLALLKPYDTTNELAEKTNQIIDLLNGDIPGHVKLKTLRRVMLRCTFHQLTQLALYQKIALLIINSGIDQESIEAEATVEEQTLLQYAKNMNLTTIANAISEKKLLRANEYTKTLQPIKSVTNKPYSLTDDPLMVAFVGFIAAVLLVSLIVLGFCTFGAGHLIAAVLIGVLPHTLPPVVAFLTSEVGIGVVVGAITGVATAIAKKCRGEKVENLTAQPAENIKMSTAKVTEALPKMSKEELQAQEKEFARIAKERKRKHREENPRKESILESSKEEDVGNKNNKSLSLSSG